MTFGEAIGSVLRQYAGFSGRASRSEFWYWYLFQILINIVAAVVEVVVFGLDARDSFETGRTGLPWFGGLVGLVLVLPTLAVSARRLHDTGRSGWNVLHPIAPMVGMLVAAVLAIVSPVIALLAVPLFIYAIVMGIVLLVWYCTEGHHGPNRYGAPPVALHAGYGYGQPGVPYARTAAPPYAAPAAPHLPAYPAPGQQLPYPAGPGPAPAPAAPGSGGLPSWGTQPQAQPARPQPQPQQPQPPQQPAAQQTAAQQDTPLDPSPWEPPAGPAEPPASPPPFRR